MPTAYIYIRFSSEIQQLGDSERRQKDVCENWCRQNNMSSTIIGDYGVSGFTGANFDGELGKFISKVRSGQIAQDSFLICENVDRISRQGITALVGILMQLPSLTIVDVSQNKTFTFATINDDLTNLFVLGVQADLARQESLKKSKRLRAAWDNKRATGKILHNNILPFGYKFNRNKTKIVIDQHQCEIVKFAYEHVSAGNPVASLRKIFHNKGYKTSRGSTKWANSTLCKILRNPAYIGIYTPHELVTGGKGKFARRVIAEPITNYFPVILEKELFEKVQKINIENKTKQKSRWLQGASTLFTSLIFCSKCKSSVVFQTKSAKETYSTAKRLICSFRYYGKCDAPFIQNAAIEMTVLNAIQDFINPRNLAPIIADKSFTNDFRAELDQLAKTRKATQKSINNIVKAIASTKSSKALQAELVKLESQLDSLDIEIQKLNDKIQSSESGFDSIKHFPTGWINRIQWLVNNIEPVDDDSSLDTLVSNYGVNDQARLDARVELKKEIREIIEKIVVDFENRKLSITFKIGNTVEVDILPNQPYQQKRIGEMMNKTLN